MESTHHGANSSTCETSSKCEVKNNFLKWLLVESPWCNVRFLCCPLTVQVPEVFHHEC